MTFKIQRHSFFGGVLISVALLSGCETGPAANYAVLNLVSVTGRITMDGKPLPNAVVTFDDSDSTFSFGMTDANGKFSLQLDSQMKGCKPGKKVVRISTTRKILGLNSSEDGGESSESESEAPKPIPAQELVPAKYYKQSILRAEVSKSKKTFDFDLQSTGGAGGSQG